MPVFGPAQYAAGIVCTGLLNKHRFLEQEPTHLHEYRPDERTLREFRMLGRLGIACGMLNVVAVSIEVYMALKFFTLYTGTPDSRIRFAYICTSAVASTVTTILLFISSYKMVQYGSTPDNYNLYRPVNLFRKWMGFVLVSVFLNTIYFIWLLARGI